MQLPKSLQHLKPNYNNITIMTTITHQSIPNIHQNDNHKSQSNLDFSVKKLPAHTSYISLIRWHEVSFITPTVIWDVTKDQILLRLNALALISFLGQNPQNKQYTYNNNKNILYQNAYIVQTYNIRILI